MNKIYANGTGEISVTATHKIAVLSEAPCKVFQLVGYANYPESWSLLTTTVANEQYTSSAFSAAATLRIDAGASDVYYETGTAPVLDEPTGGIIGSADPMTVTGIADAQGGAVNVVGGTSSTSANAGGAVSITGGTPGATGVGGAASLTAGAGGSTSGNGGVASVTGGAGTAGNGNGGVASIIGGAGQGTGNGGAVTITGGASGAGATGNGGSVNVSGGDASSTNGNGGSLNLNGGSLAGTGLDGHVVAKSLLVTTQGAPATQTTTATLTAANLLSGIVTGTHAAGSTQTYTLPTGTLMDAACQLEANECFDWVLINLSAAAADTITVAAGADHTIVGGVIVQSQHASTGTLYGATGVFRTRKTAANTFVTYRIV